MTSDQPVFRSRGTGLLDLFLNSGERHRFEFAVPYQATVELRAVEKGERDAPSGWFTEYSYEATRIIDPDTAVRLALLAKGQMPPGGPDHRKGIKGDDGGTRLFPSVRDDGTFDPSRPAEFDLLPSDLAKLFHGESRVDAAHMFRIAEVIEWRFGWSRDRLRHKAVRTEWSIDGEIWRLWPTSIRGEIAGGSAIRLNPNTRAWINARVEQGSGEPLAHELLRESEDLQSESERGSLVLAAAAFETGVKTCIVALAPETEWLLKQRSAPPALQLFQSYLPVLSSRVLGGRTYEFPKELYQTLEAGLKLRNRIVHDTDKVVDSDQTRRFRRLVRDTLYLMDYYVGQSWALTQVRERTKQRLQIPQD